MGDRKHIYLWKSPIAGNPDLIGLEYGLGLGSFKNFLGDLNGEPGLRTTFLGFHVFLLWLTSTFLSLPQYLTKHFDFSYFLIMKLNISHGTFFPNKGATPLSLNFL